MGGFRYTVALLFLFFLSSTAMAQETISGTVVDASSDETLPGVNILIKGTTTGTTTDTQGRFELSVPSLSDTLTLSFVGFETQEVPINGRTEIDITLESSTIQGQEAVITAFGVAREAEDVVGAVTSLDQQELGELQTAPSANLTSSLAGRIQGLIGFQRSGEPGANNAEFFVRGVTTFGYNRSPLILIDNIESETDDLANLNPNDIASFSILKDATATSLYGSRAANGVLLISTKEGSEGSLQVDLRVENSISSPTSVPEFADPVTYMRMENDASLSRNPLAPLPYTQRKIDKTASGANPFLYPAVDWRKQLFKDYSLSQRASLNVSGGGSIAQYFVSGKFDQSNGLLNVPQLSDFNNNIDLKNYSLRSNVNVNLTNTSELVIKISGDFDDYQGPLSGGAEVYNQIVNASPVRFPAQYPVTPSFDYTEQPLFGGATPGNTGLNPYANMAQGYREYAESSINAQFGLEQDLSGLTQGLQASALLNVERYAFTENTRTYSPFFYRAVPTSVRDDDYNLELLNAEEGSNFLDYAPGDKEVTSTFFIQAQANYNRTFRDRHGISGLSVFTARNQTYDNVDNLQESLPNRNVNFASRLTYNYDKRYYIEANFGLNASERFARNNRWGFFPSIGVSYNISNEDFWEPLLSTISNLKLRATYGLSGNDAIGDRNDRFLYLSQVNLDDGDFGYSTGTDGGYERNGVSIARYSNRSITWERAEKLNFGFDMGLFDQARLRVNVYQEKRSNILQNRTTIPASMGLSDVPQANTGAVKNQGFSSELQYTANLGNDWALRLRGNFTYAANEFTAFDEFRYPNSPNRYRLGQPVGRRFGFYADRLFIDQEDVDNSPRQNFGDYGPGDIKFRDVNKDGQITDLDRVPLGFPTEPEITYGFGFTSAYKGLDFSAFFQGLARTSFWIDASSSSGSGNDEQGTAPFVNGHQLLKAYADNHWSTNNRDLYALYPQFSTDNSPTGVENNSQLSTWFMRDGSFMRIKDVEIGYTFSQAFIERLSLRKLRVYINGRNLARFSSFRLWDPEMAGNGLGYPLQRTYNVGINLQF
jgi:TonB-linked SusC/RagA family outer membrane protein